MPPAAKAAFEKALSAQISNNGAGTGNGTIAWQLAPIPEYLRSFLGANQTLTLTYTIQVQDEYLTTAKQTITVTITNSNQGPYVGWINPAGGNWSNPNNWSTGTVPGLNDDVKIPVDFVINGTGNYPVTISTPAAAKSISLREGGAELINTSTLNVTGQVAANDGTITNNAIGTIQAGSLVLTGASELTNAGIIKLSAGGEFADQSTVTNTSSGTLEVVGGTLEFHVDVINAGLIAVLAGGALTLDSATTLNNDDGDITVAGTLNLTSATIDQSDGVGANAGTVTVFANGTLNLTNATIAGGLLTGTGIIATLGIGSVTTLDGSSGHAVTIDAGTSVTVNTGTTLQLTGTIGGGGEISVAGASKIIANGVISVPVNAAQLADGALLTLEGSAALTVINLVGDLNAAALTGTLDVTTADITGAGGINITTGNHTTTITSGALASGGTVDTIVVNASALADGTLLTLVGPANFTVTGLKGDLDVSGATGIVTIADAPTIIITTSGDGISSIDASAFADNHTLVLIGTDNTTVTGLKGDLDASGLTGTLDVTTADITGSGGINITTGNHTTTTSGELVSGGTVDTIVVDASALADGQLLTLSGLADFNVTGLIANLQASTLEGDLDVTTGTVAGLSIATGNGGNTINASALTDNQLLTLTGNDDASVTLNAGDLSAPTFDGVLTVTVTGGVASSNTITTGNNNASIAGVDAADAIAVVAGATDDDNTLTLSGLADFNVTGLIANLQASTLEGDLDVTTGTVAGLSIATGNGGNTINASALTDNQLLTLTGNDDASVTLNAGDLSAPTFDGVLTVTVTGGVASSNTITTGNNNASIAGVDAADAIAVVAGATDDDNTLTLSGLADFNVTGLIANLQASTLEGDLDVTTGTVAGLSIATGNGGNTINASALTDNQLLTLTGNDDASVTLNAGDLSAPTFDGVLTVTVTGGVASSNTITTGNNNASIAGVDAADAIAVVAGATDDDNTLTLSGLADFNVTGLIANLQASTLEGDLDVTTGTVAGLSIATGNGGNTINASALTDNQLLTLTGNDDASVTLNAGDLSAPTFDGVLTVTVTGGVASSNTITTGNNNASIAGVDAADAIAVVAGATDDDNTLTLSGLADFNVTGLIANLQASTLEGDLDVTTGTVAGLSIATGNGGNTINASALTDNQLLTLTGNDDASVTLNAGDLSAPTFDGVLTVTVTGGVASSNTITTGNNNASIAGVDAADAIAVVAGATDDDNTLTLSGLADFNVTGLIANLQASTLEGDLDVTTGTVAGLSIATGNGGNTINASALTDNQLLTLTGNDDASVTLNAGDLSAPTFDGVLTVTVTGGVASSNTITTGNNNASIAGVDAADAIAVVAGATDDDNTLTLSGLADFNVTGLIANLQASTLEGDLDVTTGTVAGLSIATGNGGNTINASALTDNQLLTLTGNDDASVTLNAGDLSAPTFDGVLTVTVTGGVASSNTITTGNNNASIAGVDAADAIAVVAGATDDDNTLTLSGLADFNVTGLIANLQASTLRGRPRRHHRNRRRAVDRHRQRRQHHQRLGAHRQSAADANRQR